jgi:hypothetical protein
MRWIICAALAVLLAGASACRSRQKVVETRPTVEEIPSATPAGPPIPASIDMGDPRAVSQLAGGFHQIEDNAWRWTEKQFSVQLGVPADAPQRGANLVLKVTLPQALLDKLGSGVTLTGYVEGSGLGAETWQKAGAYEYRRFISMNLLRGNTVKIDFLLDKALPPGAVDQRELGVIVSAVALESR